MEGRVGEKSKGRTGVEEDGDAERGGNNMRGRWHLAWRWALVQATLY